MPGANPVPDTIKAPEVRQAQIAYKSFRSAIGAVVAPRRTVASAQAFRRGAERAAKLGISLARLGRVDNVAGKFEAEFGNGTQSYVGTARVCEKQFPSPAKS